MFNKDDKRRIYWLIDKYVEGTIDTTTFDDEYYASFDLGEHGDNLSDFERKVLGELSDVVARFSEFASDHQECPGAFYTAEEVKQTAKEVKKKLADYWPPELQNH